VSTDMKTQQWERTKQILEEALRLAPEQRTTYLNSACGQDSELRAEVESLIRSHESAGSQFLAAAAPEILELSSAGAPVQTRPNLVIGNYRLLEEIGHGGMGQVWRAEQTAPVRRQVALKLIKVGMYDDEVLKRFELERQSLAIMDHPSIAKVFDAGATPDGQPYFVMEYVHGVPITDYCDQKRLKIEDRLALFIKVCEAVQHAHQKAIIHRDLKPANILVQEVDGRPVPRIIDFGLAKATSTQTQGETLYTHLGSFVGTPGFMSPEQCDATALDVDTRSDVYALGVVLYVLLTGCLPFHTGKEQPLNEMLRLVREEDPPRPSAKVSTDRENCKAAADARGTEPKQLVSVLRGDLDWVTMKALEKDRSRRYGTASELAGDIARYLNHEPVAARPASFSYRIRKYARRHRVGVAVAVGLVILLAGFAVMQAMQVRRITRERDRADRIARFMTEMFRVAEPNEARGNSITAREILDRASRQIDVSLAKDPDLQAQMMSVMGKTYARLGLYSVARPLLERAVEVGRQANGPADREVLTSQHELALLLVQDGHLADAVKLLQETLAIEQRALGPENPLTLETMSNVAYSMALEGHDTEALQLASHAFEVQRRIQGEAADGTLWSMNNLAVILGRNGRLADSEALYREELDIERRVHGIDSVGALNAMSNLGATLIVLGRISEGQDMLRQTLTLQRRVYGPQDHETGRTLYNLACAAARQGHRDEAFSFLRQAIPAVYVRTLLGMERDSDLDSLHSDRRWLSITKSARQQIAAARRPSS
jgi:serine/threonine protein kinase